MQTLFSLVGRLSWSLATAAKLLLGGLVVLVVADVAFRNIGGRPINWAVSVAEYILLYTAFLPLPWLVRNKGHVFVEFLRNILPPLARDILEKIVYLLCVALCIYLGSYAASSMIEAYRTDAFESRTFDMPQWLIFLPIVVGFFGGALEWLRFLVGIDTMYNIAPTEREGL